MSHSLAIYATLVSHSQSQFWQYRLHMCLSHSFGNIGYTGVSLSVTVLTIWATLVFQSQFGNNVGYTCVSVTVWQYRLYLCLSHSLAI